MLRLAIEKKRNPEKNQISLGDCPQAHINSIASQSGASGTDGIAAGQVENYRCLNPTRNAADATPDRIRAVALAYQTRHVK